MTTPSAVAEIQSPDGSYGSPGKVGAPTQLIRQPDEGSVQPSQSGETSADANYATPGAAPGSTKQYVAPPDEGSATGSAAAPGSPDESYGTQVARGNHVPHIVPPDEGSAPPPTQKELIPEATKKKVEETFRPGEDTRALKGNSIPEPVLRTAASGQDVVRQAVDVVDKLFPNAKDFLVRVASAESNFGTRDGTFREKTAGGSLGIWQTDKNSGFAETKNVDAHPALKKAYERIQDQLGIDWKTVEFSDLRKPLISALAARLYLLTIPESVPKDLDGQAAYWKKYYNTGFGRGSEEHFKKAARQAGGAS